MNKYILLLLTCILVILYYRIFNKSKIENLIQESNDNKSLGFIILRHVNSTDTNSYWIKCYKSIRQFYPENMILIIDDNSNKDFITNEELYKTTIINSEFPKRGELLTYYYYKQNKLFDTAVILHDSVFIQQKIDFNVDKYKIIWTFTHGADQIEDETKMIKLFNDDELLKFYENKDNWKGCFGGMTIITHDFLTYIYSKYNLDILLDVMLTRYNRCSFERVIACILQKEYITKSLLGDIHNYCNWGISIHDDLDKYKDLPLLKVWTGR